MIICATESILGDVNDCRGEAKLLFSEGSRKKAKTGSLPGIEGRQSPGNWKHGRLWAVACGCYVGEAKLKKESYPA
jgi:hypothetical protein